MQRDFSTEAHERLYKSVFMLASETGRVEERLAAAYFAHIEVIDASQLPLELQQRFGEIRAELKKLFPVHGEVNGIDRNNAVNIAMEIILLYDELNPPDDL